jgi:hypothetical protein
MIRVSPEQLVDELQRKLTDSRIYVNVVLRNGRVVVSTGKVPTDVTGMSVEMHTSSSNRRWIWQPPRRSKGHSLAFLR